MPMWHGYPIDRITYSVASDLMKSIPPYNVFDNTTRPTSYDEAYSVAEEPEVDMNIVIHKKQLVNGEEWTITYHGGDATEQLAKKTKDEHEQDRSIFFSENAEDDGMVELTDLPEGKSAIAAMAKDMSDAIDQEVIEDLINYGMSTIHTKFGRLDPARIITTANYILDISESNIATTCNISTYASESQENDSITVSEFKQFIYDMVKEKRGALPTVEDWKQIKTMMDRLPNEDQLVEDEYPRVGFPAEMNEHLTDVHPITWDVYPNSGSAGGPFQLFDTITYRKL